MSSLDLKREFPIWVIIIIPIAYLVYIWGSLPETVPIHFNASGEADGWGSKNTLIWLPLAMTIGTYLLMLIIPKIDPKKTLDQMGNKYDLIKFFMVLFMSILSCFIIYSAKTGSIGSEGNWIFVLSGTMVAVLGNYFQSIKPNYFIGIRTPWTLESEKVWKKTHRLAGRLWVPVGILLAFLPFVLNKGVYMTVFFILLTVIVLIPLVYSYTEFLKEAS